MDCGLPGSSVHGSFQARILEWVAISFSRKPVFEKQNLKCILKIQEEFFLFIKRNFINFLKRNFLYYIQRIISLKLLLLVCCASFVAQSVKNPPAMRETWVRSPLGWEETLEGGMATHSSILA